jgi:hypothetical protein
MVTRAPKVQARFVWDVLDTTDKARGDLPPTFRVASRLGLAVNNDGLSVTLRENDVYAARASTVGPAAGTKILGTAVTCPGASRPEVRFVPVSWEIRLKTSLAQLL